MVGFRGDRVESGSGRDDPIASFSGIGTTGSRAQAPEAASTGADALSGGDTSMFGSGWNSNGASSAGYAIGGAIVDVGLCNIIPGWSQNQDNIDTQRAISGYQEDAVKFQCESERGVANLAKQVNKKVGEGNIKLATKILKNTYAENHAANLDLLDTAREKMAIREEYFAGKPVEEDNTVVRV